MPKEKSADQNRSCRICNNRLSTYNPQDTCFHHAVSKEEKGLPWWPSSPKGDYVLKNIDTSDLTI